MTTDPLTPEEEAQWREQVARRNVDPDLPWKDSEVITLVGRFLATIDAVRAAAPDPAKPDHTDYAPPYRGRTYDWLTPQDAHALGWSEAMAFVKADRHAEPYYTEYARLARSEEPDARPCHHSDPSNGQCMYCGRPWDAEAGRYATLARSEEPT